MHLARQRAAQHSFVQRVPLNTSWVPHPLICSVTQAPHSSRKPSATHHSSRSLRARWPPARLQHPELCRGLLQRPLQLGVVVAHCPQMLPQQVCFPPQRLCIGSYVAQAACSCLLAPLGVLHSTSSGLRWICHVTARSIQVFAFMSVVEQQLQCPPTT